jgi:hypothetical protein
MVHRLYSQTRKAHHKRAYLQKRTEYQALIKQKKQYFRKLSWESLLENVNKAKSCGRLLKWLD